MTKISKPEYLSKVKLLTKEETERLLSRMGGKLDRRLEKNKLSREEALAIQLELEYEQLQEWRKMVLGLKKKEKTKKVEKVKKVEKTRIAKKAKKAKTPKVAGKAKVDPGK